ncbi:hypothetical protein AV654_08715 [Paenibacillus elgii]|uniref:Glycosyltransferase 2-like domain-containing protein n=1 Tax=Paenibacillus elgii TaxID=189691 RepID=A0A163ZNE1_9BACL|nr:glycosyltransferase family 2 protein [Paenibacillus elgii]KZE82130.1 hypothetical protein AV654_08715 [Paenibacillus elgii]
MKPAGISLCMIVKNEEQALPRCLESVKDVVSEMIVVDTGSQDETISIAKSFQARVIEMQWQDDFAGARNLGVDHASGEWILFLDADEELDAGSKEDLLTWAGCAEADAYFVRIINHFGDKELNASINPTIRMFRNLPGYRFTGRIHEQIAENIQQVNPEARFVMTDIRVHHYGYQAHIRASKNKTERNLALLKKELEEHPQHSFHLYNIGIEYLQNNQVEEALDAFHQSIRYAHPMANYAHLLYKCEARCYAAMSRLKEAIDSCDRGIALYPDYTDLYHYKGCYQMTLGDFQSAKQSFRKAGHYSEPKGYHTEAGVGSHTTYYLLGLVCETMAQDNEAAQAYLTSFQQHPGALRSLYRMFRLYRKAEKQHELMALIQKSFQLRLRQQRADIAGVLYRTHCYQALENLTQLWALTDGVDEDEKQALLSIAADCRLLTETSAGNPESGGPWSEDFFKNGLPNDWLPPLQPSSPKSLSETAKKARILHAQKKYPAYHQFLSLWEEQQRTLEKDFQCDSVLQMVYDLSHNAELHLNRLLRLEPKPELIKSAILSLPFDEGLPEREGAISV